MSKELKRKPSWFMSVDICPHSGLAITCQETLVGSDPKTHYSADIARLGKNMFLLKPYGYSTSLTGSELVAFIDNFIKKNFTTENRIVLIEDCVAIKGATAESRKKYITYFKNNDFIIGVVLYQLPPILKISFNLAKKLHISSARAHAVNTYEQALDLGRKIFFQDKVSQNRDGNQTVPASEISDRIPDRAFWSAMSGFPHRIFTRLKRGRIFFTEKAKQRLKNQYSEELIKFIAAIEWEKPGMPSAENILPEDVSSKKVFDAISFVKSEIDTLMADRAAVEAVVRESEVRYRLLVKHAKAGFLEYDYITNQIISVNDEFINMTGYSEQELLGMAPVKLLTEDSQKIFKKRLAKITAGEPVPQDAVYECIKGNGDIWWGLLNTNVTYQNNRPIKGSVVISNITRLKQTENQLLEYQEKLKRLSIRLSMIEEDQRRRMASHLHETIGQELFVLLLQLNTFEKSIDNPAFLDALASIRSQLLKIIKETKNLTFDLSPPVLYDFGFQEALKTLSDTIRLKHGIPVRTFFEGEMDTFDDEIKVILYRNIKELIHNAVKHAGAKNIDMRLKSSSSGLHVELCDDGIGFDAEKVISETAVHDGFGLFDIREKMNHLGGDLIIDSAPGQGTSVVMEVPAPLRN